MSSVFIKKKSKTKGYCVDVVEQFPSALEIVLGKFENVTANICVCNTCWNGLKGRYTFGIVKDQSSHLVYPIMCLK